MLIVCVLLVYNICEYRLLLLLITILRYKIFLFPSQMWQFAPNSVHYLLSLWQRMIASVPYVKAPEPHLLETYTPEVTKAYITSRLDSVAVVLSDGIEDPLDDQGMVSQQLDQVILHIYILAIWEMC